MPDPRDLLPLLVCPVCRATQQSPTTLHCGHSVCHHHLDAPSSSCPVPACSEIPAATQGPRIPPDSRVRFNPAPNPEPPQFTYTDQRTDVTLNKVLALVERTAERIDHPLVDSDNDDIPTSSARPPSRRDSDHRPRKRHKRYHHDEEPSDDEPDLLAHLRAAAAHDRLVPDDVPLIPSQPLEPASRDAILAEFDKKLLEELTCHICYVLFYQPVTTPCQHTYCAKCLQRSLDHSTTCPICRQEMPSYYFQDQPVNKILMAIILRAYPLLYQERGAIIEEDERHARLNTPIFVCQLSFPGVPTLLHFFEPRYRLMLRRCLESPNPRFGMIMSAKPNAPQWDYGTMLEIRSVQMLPDGRSMVETWGSWRFRILERGTLDGYMVGRIERIYDYPDDLTETLVLDEPAPVPSPRQDRPLLRRIASTLTGSSSPSQTPTQGPSSSAQSNPASTPSTPNSPASETTRPRQPTNSELMDTCKAFLDRLQRGAAPWVVQRLSSTYGAMPSDPALFSFWVALVLPIEEHEKAKLLPIRSARLRLMLVVHWIEQLNNNWYAWLCFVIWHGWIDGGRGPAAPCLVWLAFVLTVSRLIGWI